MPTYEIALDDGRKIHIDADDRDTALAGAQHFVHQNSNTGKPQTYTSSALPPIPYGFQLEQPQQQALPPIPDGFQLEAPKSDISFDDLIPSKKVTLNDALSFDDLIPQKQPVTGTGLAKATAAGALSGAVGIPGDVVALINLARRGYGALTGNGYVPQRDDYSLGEGYANLRKAADSVYTPKNTAESWAKTGGEFLPAIATGPEGLLEDGALSAARVLAKRAATQAAAPALAATGANSAAQGTPLEPYAGPAAALLTGGLLTRGSIPETSTTAAKDVTNASYDAARNAGVTYDPATLATSAAAAKADLNRRGISSLSAPSAHDTLDSFIAGNAPRSLTDLEEQRQLATADARKGGKEGLAANAVKAVIDGVMSDPRNAVSWMPNASPSEAFATLQKARQQALDTARLKAIEGLESAAQVGTTVHGTEPNKSLKMQFGSALKSDDFMNRFQGSPALVNQMQNVSKGSFPQGIAKRLGGGDLSKWRLWELAGLAFPQTMPAVAAARALGYALSKVADSRTQSKVNQLKASIAAQGGLKAMPSNNPWLARALIGAVNATNGQSQ